MNWPSFDPDRFNGDVDAYFAAQEARFDTLTPGTNKRVIWAGKAGKKTNLSVVYLHGFSATSEEIRPVPDLVAAALGANLVFNRLTGHGLGGEAMAKASADDWLLDAAEALAAARLVGDEVIVIATSTGGTLAALAALEPEQSENIRGIIFVSPNFKLIEPVNFLLNLPGAAVWGPALFGRERVFKPKNEDHARYWTTRYPTEALKPMVEVVKRFRRLDPADALIPALFMYSQNDRVVSPKATRKVARVWSGVAKEIVVSVQPGDDENSHVIAGDILSPGMTDAAVAHMLDWVAAI